MPGAADSSSGWYQELSIEFADGTRQRFYLHFSRSGRFIPEPPRAPAAWTALSFHKCQGCPLAEAVGVCPAAKSLESTLAKLEGHSSIEVVRASAIDGAERRVEVKWPLQQVGSVFVQLAVFSSGCPVGDQLRPFVADLRPFATTYEMKKHMVEKMLLRNRGASDPEQAILRQLEPLNMVCAQLAKRLRDGASGAGDAIPNSIARLDAFARLLAMQIDQVSAQVEGSLGLTPGPKRRPGFWQRLKAVFVAE